MKICILLLLATAAFAQGPHSNTLTWTWSKGAGDAATGFHVMKASTSGGPYTTVATISNTTTTTFVDTAVVAGQTNYYVVTAFNTGGDSTPTNQIVCVTPFQAPEAPATLSGTAK